MTRRVTLKTCFVFFKKMTCFLMDNTIFFMIKTMYLVLIGYLQSTHISYILKSTFHYRYQSSQLPDLLKIFELFFRTLWRAYLIINLPKPWRVLETTFLLLSPFCLLVFFTPFYLGQTFPKSFLNLSAWLSLAQLGSAWLSLAQLGSAWLSLA